MIIIEISSSKNLSKAAIASSEVLTTSAFSLALALLTRAVRLICYARECEVYKDRSFT
jgi:hypothetical protein